MAGKKGFMLLGLGSSKGGSDDTGGGDDGYGDDDERTLLAGDVRDAIKKGDDRALAEALCALIDHHTASPEPDADDRGE